MAATCLVSSRRGSRSSRISRFLWNSCLNRTGIHMLIRHALHVLSLSLSLSFSLFSHLSLSVSTISLLTSRSFSNFHQSQHNYTDKNSEYDVLFNALTDLASGVNLCNSGLEFHYATFLPTESLFRPFWKQVCSSENIYLLTEYGQKTERVTGTPCRSHKQAADPKLSMSIIPPPTAHPSAADATIHLRADSIKHPETRNFSYGCRTLEIYEVSCTGPLTAQLPTQHYPSIHTDPSNQQPIHSSFRLSVHPSTRFQNLPQPYDVYL